MPVRGSLPNGVFRGADALAEGFSRAQLGLYRQVLRGVYADPVQEFDYRQLARAFLMLMPTEGVIGGRSAAIWWGAPFAGPRDPVVVIVPPDSAWRGPRGVRVHRTDVPRCVRPRGGARHPDHRPAADGVGRCHPRVGERRRRGAGRHDPSRTPRTWAADPVGRDGAWTVAGTAGDADPDARGRAGQSPPESWVRVACHLAGLPPPVPQYEVMSDDGWLGRVDLAWPESRLIVEYEGEHHFADLQIHRDDVRYARLVAAGWRVIRLSAADMRDLGAVIARIRVASGPLVPAS